MANVQQPETGRSGQDPLVQDSAEDDAQNVDAGAGGGPGSGNGMSYEDELAARAEVLRNGGPTSGPGIQTTTGPVPGGTGRRHSTVNRGPGVAPTTTGDATSGGMDTPLSGATSDATSGADEFLGNPDR